MRFNRSKFFDYLTKWWLSTLFVVSILISCHSADEPIAESTSLSQKVSLSPRRIKLKSNKVVDTTTYTIDQATDERVLAIAERIKKTNWAFNKVSLDHTGTPLSFSEFFSIKYYTLTLFLHFSNYFRNEIAHKGLGEMKESEIEDLILSTISALNKLPKYSGTVYFGAPLPVNRIKSIKKGELLYQQNFTSTSKNRNTAEAFAKGFLPDQASVLYEIQNSFSGTDIAEYSDVKYESEVLFAPSTPFIVKSKVLLPASRKDGIINSELYYVVLQEKI